MWVEKNRPPRLEKVKTSRLNDAGYRAQKEVLCPTYYGDWSKKAKIPGINGLIETSRLQVLGDHWGSQQSYVAELEFCRTELGLNVMRGMFGRPSNARKLKLLANIFPSDSDLVARTGVSFAPDLAQFKQKASVLELLNSISQITVNAEFTLEGIVQKSGARKLVRRLAGLASGRDLRSVLSDERFIEFPVPARGDTGTQAVKIHNIDLGAFSLLLGLLSPKSVNDPAIYLGTDVSRFLQPYNLVFHRLNGVIEIPMTFHIYVTEIDAISGLKITNAKKDNLRGQGLFMNSADLQEMARVFAEAL
jgi:hypothetical protein